jgi:fluoroacetyl-CoA thioesterase
MEEYIGLKYTISQKVELKDTASHYGSGLIDVFATPAMIALMEKTAQLSIQEKLEDGYITLGTEICIKHTKATPVGMKVRCESKLIEADGRALIFELAAFDEEGKIGEGTHSRFIVNGEKFMAKFK